MLLQGSQSIRRQEPAAKNTTTPTHRRVATTPAPPVRTRAYAPITWDHPSLGRTLVTGLGGISKTTLMLLLFGAAFIGAAMAIALVVTGIVSAFGIDAAANY